MGTAHVMFLERDLNRCLEARGWRRPTPIGDHAYQLDTWTQEAVVVQSASDRGRWRRQLHCEQAVHGSQVSNGRNEPRYFFERPAPPIQVTVTGKHRC